MPRIKGAKQAHQSLTKNNQSYHIDRWTNKTGLDSKLTRKGLNNIIIIVFFLFNFRKGEQ